MWDMVVRSSALKYTGAFVDVATSGGGEIAANASVIKVEGSTVTKPIGTPSVIAYFVQGAYAEPYAKVVLRDMKEAGPVSGRAGKDSKSGVGRDALAALRIRHEAIATLTKKLSGEVERRGLALDAKGCYLKQKSMRSTTRRRKRGPRRRRRRRCACGVFDSRRSRRWRDGRRRFFASTAPRAARAPSRARRTQEEKAVKKEEKKDSKDKDKTPRTRQERRQGQDGSKDAKKDDKKSDKKVNSEKDAKAKVLTGAVEP